MKEYARRILQLNDEIIAEMGDPEIRKRVRSGIPEDYAAYLLPSVLSGFGPLYPEINLEVCCELSVDLLRMLSDGEVDICLHVSPSPAAGAVSADFPLNSVSLAHNQTP